MMTTTISDFDVEMIAAELSDDGDTYEVQAEAGTWTFRLRIESDNLTVEDVEDPEVFGRYECREYGRGDRDRPAGFTGAAVKIQDDANQGFYYWYEPPSDLRRFKGSGFATIEDWTKAKETNLRHVRNLLSWGYIRIGIEVTHTRPDGYHRKWSEWTGGIESSTGLWGEELNNHNLYVAEIVKEQLGEVLAELDEQLGLDDE
jgi:hypothetical protein